MTINQAVTEQSVEKARDELRRNRAVLLTFISNYKVSSPADVKRLKATSKHISKMMLSLNKVVFLKKQQEILTSMQELYEAVGIPTASIDKQFMKNLERLQQERVKFNRDNDRLTTLL